MTTQSSSKTVAQFGSVGANNGYLLAASQLGYRPSSPKTVTLVPPPGTPELPDEIPFYVQHIPFRRWRQDEAPACWTNRSYRWPFDPLSKPYTEEIKNFRTGTPRHTGRLVRRETRWGLLWQGNFSEFQETGIFQVETEQQITTPFVIHPTPYDRLIRGCLNYLYCQRSGMEVPGVRPAMHLDDAVLDTDGTPVPVAGGWYDAGDVRKWMALTQFNAEGLCYIAELAAPGFRQQAVDELRWGNLWLHGMLAPDGQVYEDVGGGDVKAGFSFENDWWLENHSGCIANAAGNYSSDNIRGSGDERKVRTSYNAWGQFGFVRTQAMAARVLPPAEGMNCLTLAEKAWHYARRRGHDQRTLFVGAELRAAVELRQSGSNVVSEADLAALVDALLARQDQGGHGLSNYFLEKDATDGFRCIGFSCDPVMALVRYCEMPGSKPADLVARAAAGVRGYIENYLLADAESNPFSVTPYGIFINPVNADIQVFRDAGRGRTVRTFIAPHNPQEMVHGGHGTMMSQAHLLARAGHFFGQPAWQAAAERLLQWATGHNPVGLSLFYGVGSHHPVTFSTHIVALPDATMAGFVGRPDDFPYIETSNAIEWCTQEVWGVPYCHTVGAVAFLNKGIRE